MSVSTYSGGWLRGAYVEPAAGKLHTADPAHGVDAGDPKSYANQAPPLTEVGAVGEYPGLEWVANTLGTVLDHTNYRSHDASVADAGAPRQLNYGVPAMQFEGEHYTGAKFASLGGQHVNPAALQRGINSLEQNNPGGFEPGQQQVNDFWVDRKFFVGPRVHDRRIVTLNTGYHDVNKPAAASPGNTTFTFDSLARAISRVNVRPQMRREPEPMSADLVTDPASVPPVVSSVSPWVVG